jgi:4,5-dihydroxyphthalate decarboxylase
MKAIEDGRVKPEGISLTFLNYRPEETYERIINSSIYLLYPPLYTENVLIIETSFFRQLRYQEFDVSECSLSSYVLTLNHPNPPFIASKSAQSSVLGVLTGLDTDSCNYVVPVFPSRMFRHQSIYVNTNSGITKPEDLKGKKVGTPEYNSQFWHLYLYYLLRSSR